MRTPHSLLRLAVVCVTLPWAFPVSAQLTLFSDNFDGYATPSLVTASGTANGYTIKFGSTVATEDFAAVFGYDYSQVTYPVSIPSAPKSTGGSTRGLLLTVNKDATAGQAAVNLYPVGQTFSGDYRLRFDVWMNWTNLATSTEHMMVGINHSGNLTNRVLGAGSDGLLFSMDGDGGSSATSTTARDYGIFAGQGANAPLLLRTNNQAFHTLLGDRFDHSDPGFVTLFPSKPIYGSTPAGSAGLGWVEGEVRQDGSTITYLLNNTVIASFENPTSFTSGDVMIGYFDIFNSIGDINNFAIFDNIVVQIPEPSVWGLAAATAIGLFCFRRRK